MRFAIYGLLVLLVVSSAPLPTTAREAKMVPIFSVFHHWDHHWYIWLPGDPVYEAVEVMSRARSVGAPLVWVFFTKRAAPKRQVHYFNDIQLANARGGHFREINFPMTGAKGQPRGITIALTDVDGSPIAVDLQFAAGAQLVTRGAGLTDQSGHSADRHLLIFFREKNDLADGTKLELVESADGQMQLYRHGNGDRVLEISFEPPLPSTGPQLAATSSVCRIALDGFRDLVTGTVRVTQRDNTVILDWSFEMPEWTRASPLQMIVAYETDNSARIAL